jgi:phosphoesterase RecJ-like protein
MIDPLNKISEILKSKQSFHILTHMFPDGDAIGSSFGLCCILQKNKKNVQVICETPEKFFFLERHIKKEIVLNPEITICVDTSDEKMIWDCREDRKKSDICIDHHISNSNYASINYVSNAAANTENIYEIAKKTGTEIDSQIAECIYTGIVSDTGRFKFSNVTPKTFRIAAEILPKLNNFEILNRMIFDNNPKNFLLLQCEAVKNCKYYFNEKCALIIISARLMEKFDLNLEKIKDITALPLKISGVIIGVIIKEKLKNIYRVSVRTLNGTARMISQRFGGGGNKNAAGFEISGNLNEIKIKILKEISKFFNTNYIF